MLKQLKLVPLYSDPSYTYPSYTWEGRYKATLIDLLTYLLTCMRYIELNPVRAGMVDHPSGYPWSSYPGNALKRWFHIWNVKCKA